MQSKREDELDDELSDLRRLRQRCEAGEEERVSKTTSRGALAQQESDALGPGQVVDVCEAARGLVREGRRQRRRERWTHRSGAWRSRP